ncbi:hypothetical protein N0V92_013106 [Colletotrichum tropicale]|nr:hypothetical protein N0V92_013106 [Colletotrichum tropicale]
MTSATTAAETTETAADEGPKASTQTEVPVMPATQAPETNDTIATDETIATNETEATDAYLTPEPLETDTEDPADGKWSIAGIAGHRVNPNDPTRLQLKIAWGPSHGREWPQTWEPEGTIQEDAFEIWSAYATSHDCRQVLGENHNK